MEPLETYTWKALGIAEVSALGGGEGFVARIPGFLGLVTNGRTKKEARSELKDALDDWIALALKRGTGLPAVKPTRA